MLGIHSDPPPVNWWILGGGLAFTVASLSVGLSRIPGGEEIIFAISMAIVLFLMWRLTGELEPAARNVLVGTAILIFVFRAIPGPGRRLDMVDDRRSGLRPAVPCRFVTDRGNADARRNVHFPPLHGGTLDCLYHWLAHRSWNAAVAAYDRHVLWPASLDRFCYRRCRGCAIYRRNRYRAGIPLGQIAMIPMLAWIANSAPEKLKATFFAVMASFTNLALSASQLGTKYMNEIFLVTREVKDPVTGQITVPADYSELGMLLISVTAIGFALPLLAILLVKHTRFRNA